MQRGAQVDRGRVCSAELGTKDRELVMRLAERQPGSTVHPDERALLAEASPLEKVHPPLVMTRGVDDDRAADEPWRRLRIGDRVRIVRMPTAFSKPSYGVHRDTRRL